MFNFWNDQGPGCLFQVAYNFLAFRNASGFQNCVKTDENSKCWTPGALNKTPGKVIFIIQNYS